MTFSSKKENNPLKQKKNPLKQNRPIKMAGSLKEFSMPTSIPTTAAKKRERNADIQDELWSKMGVEPVELIEGKKEDEEAKKAWEKANKLAEQQKEEEAIEAAEDFEKKFRASVKSRETGEVKLEGEIEQAWQEALKLWYIMQYQQEHKDEFEQKEFDAARKYFYKAYENFLKVQTELETQQPTVFAQIKKEPLSSSPEEMAVKKTILFAENISRMGLSYVYEFVGMVSTRLADRDVRSYYAWKEKDSSLAELQSPIEKRNVKTIGDLIGNNMHLGQNACAVIYSQYQKLLENEKKLLSIEAGTGGTTTVRRITTTDAQGRQTKRREKVTVEEAQEPSFRDDLQRQGDLLYTFLKNNDIELQTGGFVEDQGDKKEWMYSVLDLSAFQHILSAGSFGAMSLALGQIRRIPGCEKFTMKQLIMSEGVRDIFAIFVAFQYLLSSGGNAYAWRTGSSERGMAKGSPFMVSAGLETRKMLYAQVETAQYWFRDVYEMENPIYANLKKQKNDLEEWIRTNPPNEGDLNETIRDAREQGGVKRVEELYKNTSDKNSKNYIGKKLDLFRIEEILPYIIEKTLRHAN